MPKKKAIAGETSLELFGRRFQVRPLLRKEVKSLRKKGYSLMVLDPDTAEDALDAVLDLVLSREELKALDNLPNSAALDIWNEILALTFGSREEEKNS